MLYSTNHTTDFFHFFSSSYPSRPSGDALEVWAVDNRRRRRRRTRHRRRRIRHRRRRIRHRRRYQNRRLVVVVCRRDQNRCLVAEHYQYE